MNVSFVTATYRDLRVIETIQSLRLHHGLVGADIVVVDNAPGSPESEKISDFCKKAGVRYVPFDYAIGTSPARNKAMLEAQNDWVLCFDCHVLFLPDLVNSLQRAIDYAGNDPILFHGVKVYDDLRSNPATHFEPVFRYGMLGIWRYDPQAEKGEPFEIPGSGFGIFLVRRKDFFVAGGFHPAARGFGGEEICFHEAFRRAGGRVMCFPGLQYWHNFHQLQVRYPLYLYDKVRNYLLWFKLLNWDVERIKRHFVQGYTTPEVAADGEVCEVSPHLMTEEEFNNLLQNLDQPYSPPIPSPSSQDKQEERRRGCGSCPDRHRPEIDHVVAKLAELNISEKQLTIVTLDRRWLEKFPNARVVTMNNDLKGPGVVMQPMNKLPQPEDGQLVLIWDPPQPIGPMFEVIREQLHVWPTVVICNLGFADTISVHVYDPRTRSHGVREEKTVLRCLREWLSSTGSPYVVVALENEGNGYAIISRDPVYKQAQLPSWLEKLRNFAVSAAQHIATGAAIAPDDLYRRRIEICALCEWRQDGVCVKCGCPIYRKARWASSKCPVGKW